MFSPENIKKATIDGHEVYISIACVNEYLSDTSLTYVTGHNPTRDEVNSLILSMYSSFKRYRDTTDFYVEFSIRYVKKQYAKFALSPLSCRLEVVCSKNFATIGDDQYVEEIFKAINKIEGYKGWRIFIARDYYEDILYNDREYSDTHTATMEDESYIIRRLDGMTYVVPTWDILHLMEVLLPGFREDYMIRHRPRKELVEIFDLTFF